MAETDVRHGSTRRYHFYRCRCSACRDAKSRYNANRTRLIAYGRWRTYTDPSPAREHVSRLMARGLSMTAVADMAGVAHDCVLDLMAGTHKRGLYVVNAAALLSVSFDLDVIPDRVLVDATGTRRRVQALATLGYSLSAQSARLGRTVNNYYKVLRKPRVFAETARAVRDLYSELSMTPAPPSHGATLARGMAARNGWVSPLAWDDIDNPDARPQGVEALTPDQLHAAINDRRAHLGLTWAEVAADLGVSTEWVRQLKTGQTSTGLRERAEQWLGEAS